MSVKGRRQKEEEEKIVGFLLYVTTPYGKQLLAHPT